MLRRIRSRRGRTGMTPYVLEAVFTAVLMLAVLMRMDVSDVV